MFQECTSLCDLKKSMWTSQLEAAPAPSQQEQPKIDPRNGANNVTGSGPATHFRSAATEGVTTWGPIMGGFVAIGGTVALIGSMLHEEPVDTITH
mmetsp:Transcript_39656/g.124626  ORF Transcript_39656/g.124626 Transcript_39656/m.124626 type:complete len:95 (-) Transcript_39656:188-472(-)